MASEDADVDNAAAHLAEHRDNLEGVTVQTETGATYTIWLMDDEYDPPQKRSDGELSITVEFAQTPDVDTDEHVSVTGVGAVEIEELRDVEEDDRWRNAHLLVDLRELVDDEFVRWSVHDLGTVATIEEVDP